MIHYLILITLCALFIQGFEYATMYVQYPTGEVTNKEILWFVRFYGKKYLPEFFHKPLLTCPICMASFYGSFAFWIDLLRHWHPANSLTIFTWVVFVTSLAGLNRIITKFIHS